MIDEEIQTNDLDFNGDDMYNQNEYFQGYYEEYNNNDGQNLISDASGGSFFGNFSGDGNFEFPSSNIDPNGAAGTN